MPFAMPSEPTKAGPRTEANSKDGGETRSSRTPGTLTHQNYKVGWICALELEVAAAISMLDERHEPLPQHPYDDNSYVLGRIMSLSPLYQPVNSAPIPRLTLLLI